MKAQASILLFLIAFWATQGVSVARATPLEFRVELPQKEGPVDVHVVLEEGLAQHVTLFRELILEAHEKIYTQLGFPFKDSFYLYFNNEPVEHNGRATVIPKDGVRIHTIAPLATSSVGFSADYLRETIMHEFAHMLTLQQRKGVFRILSWLFGNTSRPVGLWPLWIHEGSAIRAEAYFGGRPRSGLIDFQLRKYAEYYQRKRRHGLDDHLLDGKLSLNRVHQGDVPYHFGYRIIAAAFPNTPQGRRSYQTFVSSSSGLTGLLFESRFKRAGSDLRRVFEAERKRWAVHPIIESSFSRRPHKRAAQNIIGPFSANGRIAWVEKDSESRIFFQGLEGKKGYRVEWKYPRIVPVELFALPGRQWLLLGHRFAINTNKPADNRIYRIDANGSIECEFSTAGKIMSSSLSGNELYLSKSENNGSTYIEVMHLRPSCGKGPLAKRVIAPESFQRISGVTASGQGLSYSTTKGRNSFEEHLVLDSNRSLKSDSALSRPQRAPKGFCSRNECWLAFENSRAHWGPVLLEKNGATWSKKRLPSSTGSRFASFAGDGSLYVQIEQWERDLIKAARYEDFVDSPSTIEERPYRPTARPKQRISRNQEVESYNAFWSMFPRFWLPELFVYDRGIVVGGSTWFEDVTQRWGGTFSLGYDSFPKRPYAFASLTRNKLGAGPFHSMQLSGGYNPAVVLSQVLNRWNAGLSFASSWALWDSWHLRFSPGIQYLRSNKTTLLRDYSYIAPVVSLGLSTAYARNDKSAAFRLSDVTRSFQITGRVRRLSKFETLERAVVQMGLPLNLGLQIDAEHGLTHLDNFPASFFELGGQAVFETRESRFLSRGFPIRYFFAKEALRLSGQLGVKWVERIGSLSWNRFRLDDVEQRFVFETVSWDSFLERSRFRMGRQYFSSVGTQFDFFGQIFHYVDFKSSFGVFYGIGDFGETRVNWTLSTVLPQ